MKYYTTKREAETAAEQNNYLLGQEMSPPFSSYTIDSITVEKNPIGIGYLVILSHEFSKDDWPELTGFRCPQVELNDYLDVVAPPYL